MATPKPRIITLAEFGQWFRPISPEHYSRNDDKRPDVGEPHLLEGAWAKDQYSGYILTVNDGTGRNVTYRYSDYFTYDKTLRTTIKLVKDKKKNVTGLLITTTVAPVRTVMAEYQYDETMISSAKLLTVSKGDLADPNAKIQMKVEYNVVRYEGRNSEYLGHHHGYIEDGVLHGSDGKPVVYANVQAVVDKLLQG